MVEVDSDGFTISNFLSRTAALQQRRNGGFDYRFSLPAVHLEVVRPGNKRGERGDDIVGRYADFIVQLAQYLDVSRQQAYFFSALSQGGVP